MDNVYKKKNEALLTQLGFVWSDDRRLWVAPAPSFIAYSQKDVETISDESFRKMLARYFKF